MSSSHLPNEAGAASSRAIGINLNALNEPGSSRRTFRNRDNELYDPNKPVLLHEDIDDGDVATAEVLTDFGFALCDEDADTWL